MFHNLRNRYDHRPLISREMTLHFQLLTIKIYVLKAGLALYIHTCAKLINKG